MVMVRRLAACLACLACFACLAGPFGCLDIGGEWKQGNGQGGNGGVLTGSSGALGGIGGDGGLAAGTFACDHHTLDSTCTTYASGTTQSDAQASCDGKLFQTVCPTTAEVGRCQIGGEVDVYYSDGATPHTATDAKQSCDFNGGTFAN